MVKAWILELDGEVIEVLPAWKFKVKLKDMEDIIVKINLENKTTYIINKSWFINSFMINYRS